MQQVTGRRTDLELVLLARAKAGHEQLPDTRRQQVPHHVDAAIPSVEVAHDRNALSVGRPDGEMDAANAAKIRGVRAQAILDLQQLPFSEQVQVVVGGDAAEPIGVVELDRVAPLEVDQQPVVEAVLEGGDAGDVHLEQTVGVPPGHGDRERLGVPQPQVDGAHARPEHPNPQSARRTVQVGAEEPEGVAVLPADNRVQVGAEGHGEILIADCRLQIDDYGGLIGFSHEHLCTLRHD